MNQQCSVGAFCTISASGSEHTQCVHAGANIGVILISSVAWGSCMFDSDTLRVSRPMQLAFPAYDEDTLKKVRHVCICICMWHQASRKVNMLPFDRGPSQCAARPAKAHS